MYRNSAAADWPFCTNKLTNSKRDKVAKRDKDGHGGCDGIAYAVLADVTRYRLARGCRT